MNWARVVGHGGTWASVKTRMVVGGQVMVGGVVSRTAMTWIAVLVLRQVSTAIHMLVMKMGQPLALVTELNVTGTNESQLSVAVTLSGGRTSERHSTVVLPGTPTRTGLIVSCTRM